MSRSPASRLRALLLISGLGMLSSRAAVAAAQDRAGTTDAVALGKRLDPPVRDAVQAIIDSSTAAGIPSHPLAAKALEGAAKRAPGDRIVAAVRSLATDLGVARAQLGAGADEGSLVAAVGAIRSGVPADYLGKLRSTRTANALAWPLSILADLVDRGVPADTAARVVLTLARSGATDAAFTAFQQQVARDVGAGVPPGAAAVARAPASGGGGAAQPPAAGPAPRPAAHPRSSGPVPAGRP